MMKKLMSVAVVATVIAMSNTASAGLFDRLLVAQGGPPPAPAEGEAIHVPAPDPGPVQHMALYHCVRYKDLDNIHPCAVPTILQVPDPRACGRPCGCCQPQTVAVQVCLPPCPCPEVKYSKHGRKAKYDFGDYEVEIESKDGVIVVDYDD